MAGPPEPAASERPTRRSVLSGLLGGSLAGLFGILAYPILRFVMPPPSGDEETSSVVAAKARDLPPGTGKIFRFGSRPAIVVRTQGGELRAFSAVCTHLQCTVQYREDLQHIWCACHNGHFDPVSGKNIGGPPPRPLEAYAVNVRGEKVVVSRSAQA